jgi:hypothetical protein
MENGGMNVTMQLRSLEENLAKLEKSKEELA